MPLKDKQYKLDQTILKKYGNGLIKITHMNILRTSGIEVPEETRPRVVGVNDEKLEENIIRARSTVFELALCNEWEYFFTATFSPEKYDRTNLESLYGKLTQWIRDYNKKFNTNIKYLLVPELHSDKENWHMHGLIMGLPKNHLKKFQIGDVMGKSIAEKVKKGDTVFNWKAYEDKFGWCDLEPIKDLNKTASYLAKYISKDFENGVSTLNKHKYYASKGLKRAEKVAVGYCDLSIDFDWSNDFCSVKTLPYSVEILEELKGHIF